MANLRSDEEAVSPVIATVLLLAITVMLSGMVFVLLKLPTTITYKVRLETLKVTINQIKRNTIHVFGYAKVKKHWLSV